MIKSVLISLIALSSLLFSCEREDDITSWDIPIDSENPIINMMIGDFKINFYLLSEDRAKTNNFTEGENFYLHFSVKNVSNNEYYFVSRFASESELNTFFNVFKDTGEDLGKSIESIITYAIGLPGYVFDPNDEVIYEFPWLFQSESS